MESLDPEDSILLIDGDLIPYRIGWGCETVPESYLVDIAVDRYFTMLFENTGIYKYKCFISGKENFREQIATTHKYKGNRTKKKPKWFKYIRELLYYVYDAQETQGYEADDALAIEMTQNPNAVCCTIDKDLLQVQGWHYRPPSHNSPEIPVRYLSHEGHLELLRVGATEDKAGKPVLKGYGYPWFYAQMLLGDITDNIVGPEGYGTVGTYEALKDLKSEKEYYLAVKEIYEQKFPENPEERLLENANLLWMVREFDDKGEPVLWEPPN